jgi:hypothetical protein
MTISDDVTVEVGIQIRAAMSPASCSVASRYVTTAAGRCRSYRVSAMAPSSSILALAPCRSRLPDRHRARSLRSLWMNGPQNIAIDDAAHT